ncbi:hypothetical protein PQR02_40610, partial [Paraburkholderia sediminicola]|uniref:hypothetical protein n=1 Tax=Paraburkholderia sediminicola TaxID=458836 RepID=UPI0038BC9D6F
TNWRRPSWLALGTAIACVSDDLATLPASRFVFRFDPAKTCEAIGACSSLILGHEILDSLSLS